MISVYRSRPVGPSLLALLLLARPLVGQTPDLRVRPGVSAGPITPASTFASLRVKLGTAGIDTTALDIGEGFTQPGTVLFPRDSLRFAALYWSDTLKFTRPSTLVIRNPGTLWTLPLGITIGTAVEELERLNGRPFTFTGFDWDYGGRAADWKGGRLDSLLGATMSLGVTLGPTCRDRLEPDGWGPILGDREVSSDQSEVRRVCVKVEEIWIGFRAP